MSTTSPSPALVEKARAWMLSEHQIDTEFSQFVEWMASFTEAHADEKTKVLREALESLRGHSSLCAYKGGEACVCDPDWREAIIDAALKTVGREDLKREEVPRPLHQWVIISGTWHRRKTPEEGQPFFLVCGPGVTFVAGELLFPEGTVPDAGWTPVCETCRSKK